jgi:hypothetical protein
MTNFSYAQGWENYEQLCLSRVARTGDLESGHKGKNRSKWKMEYTEGQTPGVRTYTCVLVLGSGSFVTAFHVHTVLLESQMPLGTGR